MSTASSAIADPHFVDAVARRVVELIDVDDLADAKALRDSASLTVAEVAARYRVSRSWVYMHQRELGAIRLGSGPRARLRFDRNVVANAIAAFEHAGRAHAPPVEPNQRARSMPLIPFEPMG